MKIDQELFFFANAYAEQDFNDIQKQFEDAANSNCYPLKQATIQDTRINYLPLSVNKQQFAEVKDELVCVYRAVTKVIASFQQQNILQRKLNLTDEENAFFEHEDYLNISGVLRFDLLYSSNGFKIVEIDADPDALFLHDMSFNTLQEYFPKNYPVAYPNHFDLYLQLMREIGIKKGEQGLVLIDPNVQFREEYEINKGIFDKNGYNVKVKPYDASLQLDKFDFVKRAYEFHRMREGGHYQLMNTLREKKTVNPLAFRLIGYKNLFMYLHEELDSGIFTDAEKIAIKKLIPKTAVYNDPEEKDFLVQHKDEIVIKPILGAEGEDVFVGILISQQEWEKLLSEKIQPNGEWLYQDLVDTSQVMYCDQTYSEKRKRYFDFSPHLFVFGEKEIFGKNLVRYSDNKILNVAQGGTFGYGIEI